MAQDFNSLLSREDAAQVATWKGNRAERHKRKAEQEAATREADRLMVSKPSPAFDNADLDKIRTTSREILQLADKEKSATNMLALLGHAAQRLQERGASDLDSMISGAPPL